MDRVHEQRLRKAIGLPRPDGPTAKEPVPDHYREMVEKAEKIQVRSNSHRGFDATSICLIALMAEEIQALRDELKSPKASKPAEAPVAAVTEEKGVQAVEQPAPRRRGRPRKDSDAA